MRRRSSLGPGPVLGVGALLWLGAALGLGVAVGPVSQATVTAPRAAEAPADYDRLGTDAEPLKAAFNAQAGAVRIVMLVAPT